MAGDTRFSWLDSTGALRFRLHPGQAKAWDATERFVLVLAGTQGGKTCFGPLWLWREMREKGPGDYLVVTPTYPLLEKKLLGEFLRLFRTQLRLGEYGVADRIFRISPAGEHRLWGERQDTDTRIVFGYATKPDSLESATAKAAWLDEAGQKDFKPSSWEAVMRRLSIHEGRVLVTTTPYPESRWLRTRLWERRGEPDIHVVRFESRDNPAFPEREYERARAELPRWKFDLYYRALFTRPAGLIYDSFRADYHIIPRFAVPTDWPRFVGLDFGGVNTAAMFYARDPVAGRLIAYREYLAGGKTAEGHASDIGRGEPMPSAVVGGSRSEGQWRREFRAAGLPVRGPKVKDVEVGIDRVYGFHARDELFVFDDLTGYLDEKQTYSRELDDNGEPTEKIADKETYHLMDAERYILSWLAESRAGISVTADIPT